MDYHYGQPINFSFPVSLWQEETLLGWYRAKDLYPEGMLLYGTLDYLHDNSIVTVRIELKRHGEYKFHRLKALVHRQLEVTELLWVNQNTDLPGLIPYIALSPAVQSRSASAAAAFRAVCTPAHRGNFPA